MRHYLLVDDNAALVENLAEMICDAGGGVTVATGGREALALAALNRFDVLVTDMRMPGLGGAQLVHEIRRVDPGLPAIVVSAYTQDDDFALAQRAGLLAVLPKPVPIARLLHLLADARRDGLVAIVEDKVALSENLRESLSDRGFSTVTAASVVEVDQLCSVAPFAGLVDLKLPGGRVGEGMRRLASRFPELHLIVMTAHEQEEPPLQPLRVFRKPFETWKLLQLLEELHSTRLH